MSPSEVTLNLSCGNKAAELLIIDGKFRVRGRGSSPLEAKLAPGIYALKAKVGDDFSERIEVLRAREEPYIVVLDPPEFESPLPLDGTSSHREYHSETPQLFTGDHAAATITLGDGSAVVFYVRDASRRNFDLSQEQKAVYAANFTGFGLMSAEGAVLVDFDKDSAKTY